MADQWLDMQTYKATRFTRPHQLVVNLPLYLGLNIEHAFV